MHAHHACSSFLHCAQSRAVVGLIPRSGAAVGRSVTSFGRLRTRLPTAPVGSLTCRLCTRHRDLGKRFAIAPHERAVASYGHVALCDWIATRWSKGTQHTAHSSCTCMIRSKVGPHGICNALATGGALHALVGEFGLSEFCSLRSDTC